MCRWLIIHDLALHPSPPPLTIINKYIEENRQNPFDNVVTESDVEEGAPNIAIVDSNANNDLDIEI